MWEFPAPLWDLRFALLGAYFALVAGESLWRAYRRGETTPPGLIAVNILSWLADLGFRAATFGLRLAVFAAAAALLPQHGFSIWLCAPLYVAVDFIYYWKHRLLHSTGWGWALHAPHHTSDQLTLLATFRLGWLQRQIDDFFFLPLILLGPPPLLMLLLIDLVEVAPAWCHTDSVGALGPLDRWLNTPANHQVHHARDRALADSNYGSTFMIWDRWFGTYRTAQVAEFGLAEGPVGLNPFKIQFGALWRWLQPR